MLPLYTNHDSRYKRNGFSRTHKVLDLEIPRDVNCSSVAICTQDFQEPFNLLNYHEIPNFLKGNPYVVSGYRSLLSFNQCLSSLFIWNNESVNIWSHLIGFVIFTILQFYDNLIAIPKYGGTLSEHFFVTIALVCYQFCMLCSAGFHLFYCHSETACKRWLAIDLAGVSIGVVGCYLPAIHFAFSCFPTWRDIYMVVILLLSTAIVIVQTSPSHVTERWYWQRVSLFVGLVGYGIVPTLHWVYLLGGLSHPLVRIFGPRVVVIYLYGIAAALFYLLKLPERFFPGKVDYIGSSHQWWHVIVVMAFVYWHGTGLKFAEFHTDTMCNDVWRS